MNKTQKLNKKYFAIVLALILLLLFCSIGVLSYRGYVKSKTDYYIKFIEERMKKGPVEFGVQQGIQVEQIVKRTPTNLVMLIKWGEKERAYVSIENWLTRAHDQIQIFPLDMKKMLVIYE